MQLPIRLDRGDRESLQLQLFEQIRGLILSGKLRPGAPLPPTRALAQQLDVSRNTAMLAYERLITEGYLQTRAAVGTFVSFDLPEETLLARHDTPQKADSAPPEEPRPQAPRFPVAFRGRRHAVVNRRPGGLPYDFWVGRPDPTSFPSRVWKRLLVRHLARAEGHLTDYGDPGGLPALRQAIADHLGPARGIGVDAQQVIIVAGIQEGLNLVARLFVRDGTPVVLENPCYQGAAFVMESHGARLIPGPVDAEGLDVSRLPDSRTALAYVTPSHQYPLGMTLPLERRLRLLDWARRTGAYIIEDDYDSDFRYNGSPLTALKGLSGGESVIYMGTFSKSVGAGLRLGYLVVPHELVEPAVTAKALMNNGHNWLDQAVMAEFVASGAYANHLRRIRRTYMNRRDALMAALRHHFGPVPLSGVEGGMHLAWHLPVHLPPAAHLQALALEEGVGVYSLEDGAAFECTPSPYRERTLIMGYSSLSERHIGEAVARLAAAYAKAGAVKAEGKGLNRRPVAR